MKRKFEFLPFLTVFIALSLSLCAGFYSVTGVGKMFAGSISVMIMMSVLEATKLLLASIVYQYWKKFTILLRGYYIAGIIILAGLTSMGIYGYLSSAYSDTFNKLEQVEKQVKLIDTKKSMYEVQLSDLKLEKDNLRKEKTDLDNITSNLATNTESQYKDKDGNIINTQSSAKLKALNVQLTNSQKRKDEISIKENVIDTKLLNLNDSINSLEIRKVNIESNSDLASEVGPLKYIARLTGKSMDTIINWFIMLLMIVFDPLAISLVIGANIIFKKKEKEETNKNIEMPEDIIKAQENIANEWKRIEEKENELYMLKSNINTDIPDLSKEKEEIEEEKKKLKKLKDEVEASNAIWKDERKNIEEKEEEISKLKEKVLKYGKDMENWGNMHWKMKVRSEPPKPTF